MTARHFRVIIKVGVSDSTQTTLAGQPTRLVRLRGKYGKNADFIQEQIYCVHRGYGYVLGETSIPAITARYKPTFNKIVASFQWLK